MQLSVVIVSALRRNQVHATGMGKDGCKDMNFRMWKSRFYQLRMGTIGKDRWNYQCKLGFPVNEVSQVGSEEDRILRIQELRKTINGTS